MNINLDTMVVSRGTTNHHRAVEILGAFRKGWQPATADHEGSGVPDYKLVVTPWITTNTDYWWMFDSTMVGSRYGLQFKESQPIQLEGPNVVFRTGEIQYKAKIIGLVKSSLIDSEVLKNRITRAKDKIMSTLNDLARGLQFLQMQKSELCL